MLKKEHEIGRTIAEDEEIRRNIIAREIQKYDLADYKDLFKSCRFLEKTLYEKDQWSLSGGLDAIFGILEDDNEMYIKVITEYFKENTPFRLNIYKKIKYLLNCIGYKRTYELIGSQEYDNRDMWMYCIWDTIGPEHITADVVNDYKEFVTNNLIKKDVFVPSFSMLDVYGRKDANLRETLIEALTNRPELSCKFLQSIYRDEDVEILLNIFRNDVDALSNIYMNAIKVSDHIDYDGKLFEKIFEIRPYIWNEYVNCVKDNVGRDCYEEKVFEVAWNCDNWKSCIDYAFDILTYKNNSLLIEQAVISLFAKIQNSEIMYRKKQWLFDKLDNNSKDIKKCRLLVDVVVKVMPDWKIEYLVKFLKSNKNIQDFKKLNLFPMSCLWSGSEVPLIIDKIKFLQTLKEQLKGTDYIEHRKYIEEYCRETEDYKKIVELREYLENADYA